MSKFLEVIATAFLHLFEVKLAERLDTRGSKVRVFGNRLWRRLVFDDGLTQTMMWLHRKETYGSPYQRYCTSKLTDAPSRILIIGLGGGGFVRYVRTRFPHIQIDVVEVSDAVVALAKEFFFIRTDDKLAIICDDAVRFAHNAVGRGEKAVYDSVILDAFGEGMREPKDVNTDQFLANLLVLLKDDGMLVRYAYRKGDMQHAYAAAEKHFLHLQVIRVPLREEYVIYCQGTRVNWSH